MFLKGPSERELIAPLPLGHSLFVVDFIVMKRSSIQIYDERESSNGVAVLYRVMIAHKNGAADLDNNDDAKDNH